MFNEKGIRFKLFDGGINEINITNRFDENHKIYHYGYLSGWLSSNKAKIIFNVDEMIPEIKKRIQKEVMSIIRKKIKNMEKELQEEIEKHPLVKKIIYKEK